MKNPTWAWKAEDSNSTVGTVPGINVLFKTKWDLEMGIGIQIVNERIEIVGVQSDVL